MPTTHPAIFEALRALDAEIAAAESRLGYSSREWTPRGYEGLADSIALANQHRLRWED